MWIIGKQGLFNTDAISFVGETKFETFIICGDRKIYISERPIVHQIVSALKNNEKFLEIE